MVDTVVCCGVVVVLPSGGMVESIDDIDPEKGEPKKDALSTGIILSVLLTLPLVAAGNWVSVALLLLDGLLLLRRMSISVFR